jgi:hypothetical protein
MPLTRPLNGRVDNGRVEIGRSFREIDPSAR